MTCTVLFNVLDGQKTLGGGQVTLPTAAIPNTLEDLLHALHLPHPAAIQFADILDRQGLHHAASAYEALQKVRQSFSKNFHLASFHIIFFDEQEETPFGLNLSAQNATEEAPASAVLN